MRHRNEEMGNGETEMGNRNLEEANETREMGIGKSAVKLILIAINE